MSSNTSTTPRTVQGLATYINARFDELALVTEQNQRLVAQAVAAMVAAGLLPATFGITESLVDLVDAGDPVINDDAVINDDLAQDGTKKENHKAMAGWMSERQIVPSGQAWTACKNGERVVKTLQKLNAADFLVFGQPNNTAAVEARKAATTGEVTGEVTNEAKVRAAVQALVDKKVLTREEGDRAIAQALA